MDDKLAMLTYGHDWATTFVRKGLANQRTRHAYIISGVPEIGKRAFAQWFAMALNCEAEDINQRPCGECSSCRRILHDNHPDVITAQTDPTTDILKIDTLREVMQVIALKPYAGRYRIAILPNFDATQARSQDALLKTLEEPPPHAVILLVAQSTEKILPTILSRCQQIPLRPVQQEDLIRALEMHGADSERAALLANLSNGRIGWALEALRNEEILQERKQRLDLLNTAILGNRGARFSIAEQLSKEARRDKLYLQTILGAWLSYWRDVLLLSQGNAVKPGNNDRRREIQQLLLSVNSAEALKAIRATQNTLRALDTNANVRMLLEAMFLEYPGLAV